MPFAFTRLGIPGVVLVEPKTFADERGWFAETYRRDEFAKGGITAEFVQDNHSSSTKRGTLRGLHFQVPPAAQGKLVRCVRGAVLDVAVDIRRGSATFGRHIAVELDATTKRMLWMPPGFAHGYQTTTADAEVEYKVTAPYSPTHERSIRWDDPALAIPWPVRPPVLHPRDAAAPRFADADVGHAWES